MNTQTIECYVARRRVGGDYSTEYTPFTIVRRTKTLIDGEFPNMGRRVTFRLRSNGCWVETNQTYNPSELEFDVAMVQRTLAGRIERCSRNHRARELIAAINNHGQDNFNGMGDYCGDEADLARMQHALDVLNGVDDVH